MKIKKIQLTTLLITLALSNVVIAEEAIKNEHKNNGTSDTVSNADLVGHTNGDATVNVNTQSTSPARYKKNINQDRRMHEQMEQRRRQMQTEQLDAYKNYLQNKKLNEEAFNRRLPTEARARHSAYLKLMEQRRALMKKMMELQRQTAEEGRKLRLHKMHQTSTLPEQAKTA